MTPVEGAALLTAMGVGTTLVEIVKAWLKRRAAKRGEVVQRIEAAASVVEAEADARLSDADARASLLRDYTAQLGFVRRQNTRLENSQARMRKHLVTLSADIAACHARHADCDRAMAKLRTEFDAYVEANPASPPYDEIRRPLG